MEKEERNEALKIFWKTPIIFFSSRKPFLGVGISYLNAIFSYYFLHGFIEYNNMFLFTGSGVISIGVISLIWGIPTISGCAVNTDPVCWWGQGPEE